MNRIIWSFVFAAVLTFLRIFIVWCNSEHVTVGYLFGVLLALPGVWLLCFGISSLIFKVQAKKEKWELKEEERKKRKLEKRAGREAIQKELADSAIDTATEHKLGASKIFGWSLATLFTVISIVAFHYESVFGRFPGIDVLYYLAELSHVRSSIGMHVPFWLIALELVLLSAFFLFSAKLQIAEPSRQFKIAAVSASAVLTLCLHLFPSLVSGSIQRGSRNLLVWGLFDLKPKDAAKAATPSPQSVKRYLSLLGQTSQNHGTQTEYPFCSMKSEQSKKGNGRSALLLVLEGVGRNEVSRNIAGQAMMPNLKRIAGESVYFKNFFSGGTKSAQAMPAMFSGIPDATVQKILWKVPALTMNGFPEVLNKADYGTAYFHGGDLSFEHQREFVRSVGFKDIIEYDQEKDPQVHGWGYDDGKMFSKLRDWISKWRHDNKETPYFASLFTLSSHDPYILPDHWKPVFSNAKPKLSNTAFWGDVFRNVNRKDAATEAYHYLDQELGRFYKWYLTEEKPKGTLLFIVGDHVPHVENELASDAQHFRFGVPLIIAGLGSEEQNKFNKYNDRLGALYDLPATLMPLLGLETQDCNVGVDLLADASRWNSSRLIYAVGGDSLDRMYFWNTNGQAFFDRRTGKIASVDIELVNKQTKSNINLLEVQSLLQSIAELDPYLIKNNAYFPAKQASRSFAAIESVKQPLYASHRGNTTGPGSEATENSMAGLEKVSAAGFEWVEIDIQITKDGILVLRHDNTIRIGKTEKDVFEFTFAELKKMAGFENLVRLDEVLDRFGNKLNFLIEAKPQRHISYEMELSRKLVKLLREKKISKRVIIDSFKTTMAASIKAQCQSCETAIDAPYKEKISDRWLDFAKRLAMDWVYVEYSVLDTDLIRRAHERGLKIMAYTVNDSSAVKSWDDDLPDGIITDTAALLPK